MRGIATNCVFTVVVGSLLSIGAAAQATAAAKKEPDSAVFRLSVRAGDTGEELRDVEVRQTLASRGFSVTGGTAQEMRDKFREFQERSKQQGPQAAVTLVEGASSPVSLEPFEKRAELFVRSPGYAWASVTTKVTGGGGAAIVLWPAAKLEIELDGEVPEGVVAHLRLYEMGAMAKMFDAMKDQPGGIEALRKQAIGLGLLDPDDEKSAANFDELLEAPLEHPALGTIRVSMPVGSKRPVVFESLPTRPTVVSVELGEWFDDPVVLASAAIDLGPGATHRVKLSFDLEAPPEPIDVKATLVIPASWREAPPGRSMPAGLNVTLHLLDRPLLDRKEWLAFAHGPKTIPQEGNLTYRVDWFGLQPGRYEVRLDGPTVNWDVTIDKAGKLQLEAPPPAEVVLRVIDPMSEKPAEDAVLVWYPEDDTSNLGRNETSLTADPETRSMRFFTGPGRVTLQGGAAGLRIIRKTIEVAPGRNEIDVVGTPEYAFTVRLIGDDGLVRIREEGGLVPDLSGIARRLDVRGPALGGRVLWSHEREEGSYIVVSSPGTYRFDIPPVDGYRPVPRQEVVIEDNRPVVHEIRLERVESPDRPPEKSP